MPAYNCTMLQSLNALLAPAVMERLTLVLNHVLGAEAVATDRLRPHAGRTVEAGAHRLAGAAAPAAALCLSRHTRRPAGVERPGTHHVPADLSVRVDGSNPALLAARALAGEMPAVDIEGDAQLAGDVNWLIQNLRWDVAADLERFFGPAVAQQLSRLGGAVATALRTAIAGAGSLRDRLRPRA